MKRFVIAVLASVFLLASIDLSYAAPDAKVVKADSKVVAVEKKEVKKDEKMTDKKEEVSLPKDAPKTVDEALDKGKEGIEFAKVKNWFGMSSAIIFIMMFLMKMFGLFKKVGKRWAYIIVPVLSMAAMLCAKFAGGLSWEAAYIVMTSGPFVALLNDFVKRGVLGKEHATPVNGQSLKVDK